MSDQAELLRLRDAGLAVTDVLARRNLSREERIRLLSALLAKHTLDDRRQDQWIEAVQMTAEGVALHCGAEIRRRMVHLANAPVRGNA